MNRSMNHQRIKRLFSLMDDSIDSILIVNAGENSLDENFRYLTDAKGGIFEGSFAIASRKSVAILTSVLEEGIAKKTGCRVISFSSIEERDMQLRRIMRNREIVGVNENSLTVKSMKGLRKILKGVKFRDIAEQLSKARMIKQQDELVRLKRAGRIASRVASEIPEILRIGMTEREAAAEIDYLLKLQGADAPAFDTIAAFGLASALPHYMPGKSKLKSGSVALFDFGATFQNYKSDITRTFLTKPGDRRLIDVYDIVLKAQKAAVGEMIPGTPAKNIDAAARNVIEKAGYGRHFIHSTGHGLGISAHDPGSLSKKSKDILEENMVFTVEPGIYLPNRGGTRIEDDFIIARNGAKLITNASRELQMI